MSDVTLGVPHTAKYLNERDAVHVCVVCVAAGETLFPGSRVKVGEFGAQRTTGDDFVGVVDPFLDRPAQQGECVWLLLKPKCVTSLKHHWTHPAFPEPTIESATDDDEQETWCKEAGCD